MRVAGKTRFFNAEKRRRLRIYSRYLRWELANQLDVRYGSPTAWRSTHSRQSQAVSDVIAAEADIRARQMVIEDIQMAKEAGLPLRAFPERAWKNT